MEAEFGFHNVTHLVHGQFKCSIGEGCCQIFSFDTADGTITRSRTRFFAKFLDHIVEFGPGKVLAGLVKRIDADLTGSPLFDPTTLAQVKELLA